MNYLGCALKWHAPGFYPWQIPAGQSDRAESLTGVSCEAVLKGRVIGLNFGNTDIVRLSL